MDAVACVKALILTVMVIWKWGLWEEFGFSWGHVSTAPMVTLAPLWEDEETRARSVLHMRTYLDGSHQQTGKKALPERPPVLTPPELREISVVKATSGASRAQR